MNFDKFFEKFSKNSAYRSGGLLRFDSPNKKMRSIFRAGKL
jgi:hypothetical protein